MDVYSIVKEIASCLGDGWEAKPEMEHRHRNAGLLHSKSGSEIMVTEPKTGKLQFYAIFPRTKYTYSTAPDGFKPEINVSSEKSPVTIAKSLKKRLLDRYVMALEAINQKIREEKEKEKAAQAFVIECQKKISGSHCDGYRIQDKSQSDYRITSSYKKKGPGVEVRISDFYAGEKGDMKLTDVPREMLLHILEIVTK